MMRTKTKKIIGFCLVVFCIAAAVGIWFVATKDQREFSKVTYAQNCMNCHAADLKGTRQGSDLLASTLKYGEETDALIRSIQSLEPHKRLAWPHDFPATGIKALALFVSEHRQQYPSVSDSYQHKFEAQTIRSDYYTFRVEKFADLASRPYSIAPRQDGSILVSEKVRGLSIVDANGQQGELLAGLPTIYDKLFDVDGAYVGWGHALEVALHPNYDENGWIYLSFADRCQLDCGSPVPQSMVKVIRGRIKENNWVDEELIWSVDTAYYTVVPDAVAGGRLAFDNAGYLYITVGGKSFYKHLHNMNTPYGKIHRVKDDGTVPNDNPFWAPVAQRDADSTRHTVWSYGHRTTQGLTEHPVNGEIWASEMGPRGGDEINHIMKGGNYGWPLYTNGLDYDSTEITIGKDLGLDFPIEDTVLPAVDFTPAPALSNVAFHQGDVFPLWQNDMLAGSLKAMSIYRLRFENGNLEEKETLATNIGRIRDIEMGADGLVYVAIEHGDTGSIVRLVPTDTIQ